MGKGENAVFFQPMKSNAAVMEALRRVRLGSAAERSGPSALAARREGYAQGLRPFRCGEEEGDAWGAPRRLKACGLSLCGCRRIFLPKSTGRRIRKRLPGRYFSG